MTSSTASPESSRPPKVIAIHSSSPRHHHSYAVTPVSGANRRIGIAVDLSDESAFAVKWAVQNYLRPGDAVILLHVAPTDVLYGADWGSIAVSIAMDENLATSEEEINEGESHKKKLEDDFEAFTVAKSNDLAQPLVEANIPFKIHIVKDHDMKERLCLEVERLGLNAMIMGSRGFGASRRSDQSGRLGSVSDYCVHHCFCPVIVVRYPEDKDSETTSKQVKKVLYEKVRQVKKEGNEAEFHDASDKKLDKGA